VFAVCLVLIVLTKLPSAGTRRAEHVPMDVLKQIADETQALANSKDRNDLVALMNATSGLAMLNVLRRLDTSHKLPKKLDTDLEALRSNLATQQRTKLRDIGDTHRDLRVEEL